MSRVKGKSDAEMAKAVGPQMIVPISPAVVAGDMVFATCIPVDLQSGAFVSGPIERQARQVFENLRTLLREAGGGLEHVAHLTIHLVDSKDLPGLNAVYKEFFTREPFPARATVIVRELVGPPDLRIQTTAHAYLKDD
ncbi:MAG TPA: RidA family protein [Roseiarcus sp.]|nr:RidA family protein [Roseiarcus sp.]